MSDNANGWEPLDFTNQTRSWRDVWEVVEGDTGVEIWDGDDVVLTWDRDDLDALRGGS